MTKTDVVIAGAGPTGLMLATELRLSGVEVLVLDRLEGRSGESRGSGLHARSLEVLDQRGIVDQYVADGQPVPGGLYAKLRLDFSRLATRYPYTLLLLQNKVELLLEQRAADLGVPVHWSSEVAGLRQDDTGVEVEVRQADGSVSTVQAKYIVGCDGGRSAVRKLAGIDFPGTPATLTAMLGDVELTDPPAGPTVLTGASGNVSVLGYEPGWYRVFITEYGEAPDRDEPMTFERLRDAMIRIAGTDLGMHSPRWLSHFGDAARQAAEYRRGRVLLAGDAAHIHFPAGGQGMNLGMQDAVNLGWKLAAVINGHSPDELLDTYHAERHPVAERVLHNTRAETALTRPGTHTDALRDVFGGIITIDEVNFRLSGLITGLDTRYAIGEGGSDGDGESDGDRHPLLGHRFPDLDLTRPGGEARVFSLLHKARPVLLNLTDNVGVREEITAAAKAWADRLDIVDARCADVVPTAVTGAEIPAPASVLIRPDGHTAWVAVAGEAPDTAALESALTTWLGPALW